MEGNIQKDIEDKEISVYKAWLDACEKALKEGEALPLRPALIYLERNL